MPKGRSTKFKGRYDLFLSNASNEEVVSISKELSEELSSQSRIISATGISLIAISVISLIIAASYIAGSEITATGTSKSILITLELFGLLLFGASAVFSGLAVVKSVNASSVSTMFWRHVRETADDEKVYEQRAAIESVNILVSTSKQNLKGAVMLLICGGLSVCFFAVYTILVGAGYF